MKRGLLFFMLITFLAGCGEKADDFKAAKWGMTVDEVILLEEELGNELYDSDISFGDEMTLEYEDVIIDGHMADVEYNFSNEVSKYILLTSKQFGKVFDDLDKKLSKDSLSDEEKQEMIEKFEEDNKELIDEFENMPDSIKLNNIVLTEGEYWFYDLDDVGREEIFDTLVSLYGEPVVGEMPYDQDEAYSWSTERTNIMFFNRTLSYQANYKSLEEFMRMNKQSKKSGSDL